MVSEITTTGQNLVWSGNFNSGTNSCTYNFDGSANAALKAGSRYQIILHSYNENSNQATSVLGFTYQ